MTQTEIELPQVVSRDEWREAREALLDEEKEATRALDALAAERRRLPMVEIEKDYTFEGPDGTASLVDLFDGRRQLIIYHFMFDPDWDEGCDGCSSFVDNVGHLAHLHARDTSFALVSHAPRAKIEPFKERMGWTVPWYSSFGGDFNRDFGVTTDRGETFGLSVFLRDGDRIFQTYFTDARGVDRLRIDFNLLDLTPYGRQETWEDSPEGWPQTPPYEWWRLHDEYEDLGPDRSTDDEEEAAMGPTRDSSLPDDVRALFSGANYAHVATRLPDGSPHSVPIWVGVEGDRIAFLTSPGSRKARNLEHDPRVSISITDADRPSSMAQVRGRVSERLEGDRAWEVIDRISHKYVGQPYPLRTDRVVFLVETEHAVAQEFG